MKIRPSGFTTVELLITMVLAGLLLALAVPSYTRFVASSRVMDQTNDLVSALTFARSEAIKRNANIWVCRAATAAASDCASGDVNWTAWIVTTAASGGTVLRRGALDTFGGTHVVRSSLPAERVRFAADGLARTNAAGAPLVNGHEFIICSTRYSGENIRRLTLGAGSRISNARESGTCS